MKKSRLRHLQNENYLCERDVEVRESFSELGVELPLQVVGFDVLDHRSLENKGLFEQACE